MARTDKSKKNVKSSRKGSAKRRGVVNRRANQKNRKIKAQSKSATWDDSIPWRPDPLRIKFIFGLLLLPVCFLVTQTFFSSLTDLVESERSVFLSVEFLSFFFGGILWVLIFFAFPNHRPIGLYVWGHEMSHAFAATLFGANITGFSARKSGGYIYTSKTNFIISLAPYLIPIYTLMTLAIAVVASLFFDILQYHENMIFGVAGIRWVWLLLAIIGFTWSFHLTFTLWMISRFQPDLEENGNFFSLILIYLANLLIICLFVVAFSKQLTVKGFWSDFWANGVDLIAFIKDAYYAGLEIAKTLFYRVS